MVAVVADDAFYIWMVAVVAADSFYIWMVAVVADDAFYICLVAVVAGLHPAECKPCIFTVESQRDSIY
jgi:hypothetical protein